VEVGEGRVEGGGAGLEMVGDEEEEGLVAGVGVGAPVVVGECEGGAVAAGLGAGDEFGGGELGGLLDGDGEIVRALLRRRGNRRRRWGTRAGGEGVGPEA
jgi:hypothetical protein